MKMMMVLKALYWKWALISEPMLFLWGAIPDCRTPPIVFVPPSVPFPYPARLCISAVPRSYPSDAVPCSCSVPPPAAMQGHKPSVQRCKHRPDPGAVRACSCKPSQPTVPPTLGWELKKFTKSSSRWTIQPENPNRMQRMKGIKVNGPPKLKFPENSLEWDFLTLCSKTLQLIVSHSPTPRAPVDLRGS